MESNNSEKHSERNVQSNSINLSSSEEASLQMEWKPRNIDWLIFLCLAILSLVVSLDTTILVPILPSIAQSLDGTTVDTFWTGTSYLLTSAICQPFIVSLSDSFGRRQILFICVSFFAIGTIVCCRAHDFPTIFAGRSIQGVGGGGMLALGLVITTDIVPLRQRPTYYGILQLAWALGAISGPVAGGAFAQHTTWRWAFYLNFPFIAVGLIMVPFVVRLQARRAGMKERVLHTDWIGAVLFISSSCSFLIGITWGGNQYPWDSWRTLVPIIVGAAGIVATLIWERYGASQPFIRLWLFSSRAAAAAYACAILQGLLMFCLLYYLPLWLQSVKGFSPLVSGAGLAPITGGLLPTSIIVGALITRFGHYRWAIWTGWLAIIASNALLIILGPHTSMHGWLLIFIALGPSQGLVLISLNFSLQALAKERDSAYAASMYTFMRSFGMCLGVAIGGTVFQNRLASHLASRGLDVQVAHDAEAFIITMKLMTDHAILSSYREAYCEAFRNVFQVLVGVAGLGGLLSLFIKHESMDRALESEHIMER